MIETSPVSNQTWPSDRPVRLGIVGTGSVSNSYNILIQEMIAAGEAVVTMACERDPDYRLLDGRTKRDRILGRWPDAKIYTDHAEAVHDPDVDLVVVITNIQQHYPVARAALEAGKHVLVEKPMATTLEDGRALVELANRSPGQLICAPYTALSPTFRQMWQRLHRGDIGKVLLARAVYGENFTAAKWHAWLYQAGAGVLFEIGCYNLTTLTSFLGPAKRVTAFTGRAIPEREMKDGSIVRTEAIDNAQVLLDFGDAVYASVTTGYTMNRYRGPAVQLFGTDGTLQMLGEDWRPEGWEYWHRTGGGWDIHREDEPYWFWAEGIRHMVRQLRRGQSPIITPEQALHVLDIMIKAAESGADGMARDLETTFSPLDLSGPDPDQVVRDMAADLW